MFRGDQEFYRRWSIEALTGPVAVTLHLSFSPGFTEQMIHVRGTLASATVDFERNTYLLHQHTRYGLDFDRYRMIRQEASSLAAQARRSLTQYALSKLKLSSKGSPYGLSIARALQSFYAGLGRTMDSRLSPDSAGILSSYAPRLARWGLVSQQGLRPRFRRLLGKLLSWPQNHPRRFSSWAQLVSSARNWHGSSSLLDVGFVSWCATQGGCPKIFKALRLKSSGET